MNIGESKMMHTSKQLENCTERGVCHKFRTSSSTFCIGSEHMNREMGTPVTDGPFQCDCVNIFLVMSRPYFLLGYSKSCYFLLIECYFNCNSSSN